MTLRNFEEYISPVILGRGYDYFIENRVLGLEEDKDGVWNAEVKGTGAYHIQVKLQEDEIIFCDCDCPVEGNLCKHITAVLYTFKEQRNTDVKPRKKKESKRSKTNTIESIFDKVTKDELKEFIRTQFSEDRTIKNKFISYFAEYMDDNAESKYKYLIKSIIKAAEDKYGFINYRSSNRVNRELGLLLNKAHAFITKGNIKESLAICKNMIKEIPPLVQHMDDSGGSITSLWNFTFDIFSNIIDKAPPMLKDELFSYCLARLSEEQYNDFDFAYGFLDVMPRLATTGEQENQFLKFINDRIKIEKERRFSEYRISRLLLNKIELLKAVDKEDEAWRLIEENKKYPAIMTILVDDALRRKDYLRAVNLCYEGIQFAEEKRHPGTVTAWNNKLLSIYEKTNNIVEIRKMSEKLFFQDLYNMTYYRKLKAAYSKNEWADVCESIINNIKGKSRFGSYGEARVSANIFVEENYKERLIRLMEINSEHLELIDKFSGYVKDEYPAELLNCYEIGIKKYAENTGRRYYKYIASYLKKLQKIKGGKDKTEKIVKYFKETYRNRPAMMEVLNKNL